MTTRLLERRATVALAHLAGGPSSNWRWAYWVYPVRLGVFYLIAAHMGITETLRR